MLKGPNRRWIWVSVLSSVGLIAAGLLLLCPPRLFHSRFPGQPYLLAGPRYLTAASDKDGKLAIIVQYRGQANVNIQRGTKWVPVTRGILDADPVWDLSGTRIAYVTLGNHDDLSLRIYNLGKASDVKVLEQPLISQPQWCNDGTKIFFLKSRRDVMDRSAICSVDLRTKKVTTVAETDYNRPRVWGLAARDQLVYCYKGAVWTKFDKEPAVRLPVVFTNPCMAAPSPDGRVVVACNSFSAFDKTAIVIDLGTHSSKQMYRGSIRDMLWSPSGRLLALVCKGDTRVFQTSSLAPRIDGWRLLTTLKGIAVCWRSDAKLVLISPSKTRPYSLVEVDPVAGTSTRLAP